METMLRLGWQELLRQWRLALVMAFSISIPLMGYLILNGYITDLNNRYDWREENYLVVQESGSMGEFYGSRLKPEVGESLHSRGISLVVPEIHTVTGTTMDNAVLLRGIPLDLYTQVEQYRIISGRLLLPSDPPRLALVGIRLAEERNATPGGAIEIRGREFQVVGVQDSGTYADYEAWVSLGDAQELLGWDKDVSVYVIPAGQGLQAGDALPGGISVVAKGESGKNLVAEYEDFINLLTMIMIFLGISAAVALANSILRLAWLRRREIAILLTVGFNRRALAVYLAVQSTAITLAGFLLGLLEAVTLASFTRLQTAGIAIHAVFDLKTILLSLVFSLGVLLLSTALPVGWLTRLKLSTLLRAE